MEANASFGETAEKLDAEDIRYSSIHQKCQFRCMKVCKCYCRPPVAKAGCRKACFHPVPCGEGRARGAVSFAEP